MPQPQVTIQQATGGLNRRNYRLESISAFVSTGIGTANYTVGNVVQLTSARQLATQYLIDEAYDNANGVLVYHHVREFFRLASNAKLWFLLAPVGTSMADMLSPTGNFAARLLLEAGGEVFQLGVSGGGGFADTLAAIPIAQSLVDAEYSNYRYLASIVLEGRNFNTSAALAADLHTLAARNVSVVIAQDLKVANNPDNPQPNYAAIGTALGTIARADVHASIGWVQHFNLHDPKSGAFYYPALSSNIAITGYVTADLDTLHDKGYIFARTFSGYSGTYFNSSPTAAPGGDDYYCIEYNRVFSAAARIVRKSLLPYLNAPLQVDAVTGRLHFSAKAMFEAMVRTAIEGDMSNNISALQTVIVDPALDENAQPYPGILTDGTLRVYIVIVPFGKAEQIIVSIGFINPAI